MKNLFIVFLSCIGTYLVLAICMISLTEEKIEWKKLGKLVCFAGIPSSAIYYLVNYAVDVNPLLAYAIGSLSTLVIATAVSAQIWKRDYWRSLSIVGMAGMMQVNLTSFSVPMSMISPIQEIKDSVTRVVFIEVTCMLIAVGISWLLRKMQFSRAVRYLLEDEKNKRRFAVKVVAMEFVTEIFYVYGSSISSIDAVIAYGMADVILLFLLIGIVIYISKKEENAYKLQLQQSMILQQQMYLEHLEQMQQEMRVFRHDYKNMLSGMYLYAKEGEIEKIQNVLEKLEIDFDQKIGEKIHLAAQIGNIQIPEVKSLLLSKLTKMNKEGIECTLEALYPLTSIQMDVWDFTRCLGILIDNALEAAAEQQHPNVELLFMCPGRFLTVRVANSWEKELDIVHMWKEGYSTKGQNRGLGLASYQRILAQYPDVVPFTSYENNILVQEFTVAV